MKTVMCFGDSNTWGFVPGSEGERFPYEQRVCGVVADRLGNAWRVVEEGLNGRTTCFDDPIAEHRNGRAALPMLLLSHAPLDVVAIMLGTNDLKSFFHLRAVDIALGAAALVEMVQQSAAGPGGTAPRVLLISPPHVGDEGHYAPKFDATITTSHEFANAYHAIAEQLGCGFLDAAPLCHCPTPDGIHLDQPSIVSLAEAMAQKITDLSSRRQ